MNYKRISIFAGHYGSGKTNIAINYARYLKTLNLSVCIADLDIVNPYFRTNDSAAELAEEDIKLICSPFAGSNVDLPSLPQELYSVLDNKTDHCVLDVGGDDRGALALGRFVPGLLEENDYEMIFVINCYRPLSKNVKDTVMIMREIEVSCGLKFTAIANNSNLGEETTAEDVLKSVNYASDIAEHTRLPIKMTCVKKDLIIEPSLKKLNPFPLILQDKSSWL